MKILDIPQSGSVAAVTSSRNRSGQYRRSRAMPTQPRTAPQVQARARLSQMSAAWRGLTDVQRASWKGFADSFSTVNSIGSTIQLTGAQCFVKLNCVLLLLGSAVISTPPALPAFGAVTASGLTASAAVPSLALAGVTPTVPVTHMIYASPQLSAGVSYCGTYRYLGQITTYTSGSYDLLALYTAKFGSLVTGNKIFVKVVQVENGFQDNGTLFTAIVGT
jgi:hypothetical protein